MGLCGLRRGDRIRAQANQAGTRSNQSGGLWEEGKMDGWMDGWAGRMIGGSDEERRKRKRGRMHTQRSEGIKGKKQNEKIREKKFVRSVSLSVCVQHRLFTDARGECSG